MPFSVADSPSAHLITLTREQNGALADVLTRLSSPFEDTERYLSELYRSFIYAFPREHLHRLLQFKRDPDGPGTVVFDQLPLDPTLPPTPPNAGRAVEKRTFISESVLLGLAQVLGE